MESLQRIPQATPSTASQDCPSLRCCERSSLLKNRMREICTFGSVRGGGGNIPAYSAQAVTEHVELAGAIADDNGVLEQTMVVEAAGDHGRLGDPPTMTGAEAVQVGLPRRIIVKASRSDGEQSGDDAFRHTVFNQIGQRRGVDHIVR